MAIGWLDLELRHLATLRVLAEERSFRGTAKRLGFAQSGISRHISTLEQRVGVKLVERGHGAGGVELTAAGELLLEHANEILSVVALAERDFGHRTGRESGAVRVGTFQSISSTILAEAIAEVKRVDPRLLVELVETTTPIEQLRSGALDLAFSETLPKDPRVTHVELLHDPYLIVSCLHEEPVSAGAVVSVDELVKVPLLTFRNSCHLAEVERELAERRIILRPIIRNDDALTLQSLAARGAGVALLPRLAISQGEGVRTQAVDASLRARPICLAWNSEPAPTERVALLIESIRRAANAYDETPPRTSAGPRIRAA
jgi:DNA-binding transcriptional LysR family regulator